MKVKTPTSFFCKALPLACALALASMGAAQAQTSGFLSTAPDHQLQSVNEIRSMFAEQNRVRVIVGVPVPSLPAGELNEESMPQFQSLLRSAQAEVANLISEESLRAGHQYQYVPFMAIEVSESELDTLLNSNRISSIEPDRLSDPQMPRSNEIINAPSAWAAGYDGTGWSVAVLDTGVATQHPHFNGRIVAEACYSTTSGQSTTMCPSGQRGQTGPGAAEDCTGASGCGHGTHVSGTVLGESITTTGAALDEAGTLVQGVAKNANLIGIQVFSRFPSHQCDSSQPCVRSYNSDQIAGLEYVYSLRNELNIASVNMSLGGGRYYDQASCDNNNAGVKSAIDLLRGVGIATAIASGNSGYSDSLGGPACISSGVSVGSTMSTPGQSNTCGNGNDVDAVSCFSNSAEFLDLLAPGHFIFAPDLNNSYSYKAGTSMAAPHVAGCFAVLRQALPNASVDEVLSVLKETGTMITDSRNDIAKPRIDCGAAIAAIAEVELEPEVDMGTLLMILRKRRSSQPQEL